MTELKAHWITTRSGNPLHCYLKSEADNVIAEKDEVIAELKVKLKVQTSNAEKTWKLKDSYHTNYAEAVKELCDKNKEISKLKESHKNEVKQLLILNSEQANAANGLRNSMEQVIFHQKYKRCLDNAWWCRNSSNAYAWSASNLRGWKIAVYYDKKAELYRKWHKRWLELAEKFKEGV